MVFFRRLKFYKEAKELLSKGITIDECTTCPDKHRSQCMYLKNTKLGPFWPKCYQITGPAKTYRASLTKTLWRWMSRVFVEKS